MSHLERRSRGSGCAGDAHLRSVGLHTAVEKLDCDESEPFRVGVTVVDGPHDAFGELLAGLLLRKGAGKVPC